MMSQAAPSPLSIGLSDASQVGEARRLAADLGRALGFDDTVTGRLSIMATEMANNVIKHAGTGRVILRSLGEPGSPGVELLTLDKGPGIANVAQCLEDGYSTAGSPGTGLGAISRLSTFFDIYSQPQAGTAVMAQLWPQSPRVSDCRTITGAVNIPKAGEHCCGDAWAIKETADRTLVIVADGLGHGTHAARAAEEALRIFHQESNRSPQEIILTMQVALRSTRGASVAVAEVQFEKQIVRYAGVGNIAGVLITPASSKNMVSHNGTVGHELHRVQEFIYPWRNDTLLVLHSDGLQTRWSLANYPGLVARHPSLLAGVLYRDFERGTDDVTVLALREQDPEMHRIKAA